MERSRLRRQFRFETDIVIDGVTQPLRAADITLSRLHSHVSEQELNLIELSICLMTQPSTCSAKIVRCDVCKPALRAGILHDSPDRFRAKSSRRNPPTLIDRSKNRFRHDLCGCSPGPQRLLDPRRNGHGSDMAPLADKVGEHPFEPVPGSATGLPDAVQSSRGRTLRARVKAFFALFADFIVY
jgi:hypothetical protein